MSDERGVIRNRARGKQIIDFSDLRYGNITPTDIDCCIDWHNRAWVFVEYKVKGNKMPDGQELFYKRLCNDLSKKKPTIVIEAYHEEPPTNDIDGGACIVSRYYYKGEWHDPLDEIRVADAIQQFYALVDKRTALEMAALLGAG